MYMPPGMLLGLTLPFLPVFSVLTSHRIISCSGYPPTTFLPLFTPPLLYISQPLQSTARPQIPWCGAQGNEGISLNTTCDSQMLLLICSRGCLWPMWRSGWPSETPKAYKGRKKGKKKIEKGKVLVQFLSQVNLCFLTLVAQLYSRTLELISVEFVFVESKCHQYMIHIYMCV